MSSINWIPDHHLEGHPPVVNQVSEKIDCPDVPGPAAFDVRQRAFEGEQVAKNVAKEPDIASGKLVLVGKHYEVGLAVSQRVKGRTGSPTLFQNIFEARR